MVFLTFLPSYEYWVFPSLDPSNSTSAFHPRFFKEGQRFWANCIANSSGVVCFDLEADRKASAKTPSGRASFDVANCRASVMTGLAHDALAAQSFSKHFCTSAAVSSEETGWGSANTPPSTAGAPSSSASRFRSAARIARRFEEIASSSATSQSETRSSAQHMRFT